MHAYLHKHRFYDVFICAKALRTLKSQRKHLSHSWLHKMNQNCLKVKFITSDMRSFINVLYVLNLFVSISVGWFWNVFLSLFKWRFTKITVGYHIACTWISIPGPFECPPSNPGGGGGASVHLLSTSVQRIKKNAASVIDKSFICNFQNSQLGRSTSLFFN